MRFLQVIQQRIQQAHWLSLDVAIGAVLSHFMAARLPDGHQPASWVTGLGLLLCVFIVYATDRLLDLGRNPEMVPSTARHAFHARLRNRLVPVLAGAVVMGIGLLFWVPIPVLWFGLGLAALCAAYVWGVSRLSAAHAALIWKEPVVALLFTAGVWGSAWAAKPTVSWPEIGLAVLFLGIAFQNILLFSVMEAAENFISGPTLATYWGPERCDTVLRATTGGMLLLALALCMTTEERFTQRAAVVEALMSGVLYVMQRYPTPFLKNDRYRWLGDGVFWLPALIL